jgi:hypothetical protein
MLALLPQFLLFQERFEGGFRPQAEPALERAANV